MQRGGNMSRTAESCRWWTSSRFNATHGSSSVLILRADVTRNVVGSKTRSRLQKAENAIIDVFCNRKQSKVSIQLNPIPNGVREILQTGAKAVVVKALAPFDIVVFVL